MIYLMSSESRNGTYFKVGYTSSTIDQRLKGYITSNPNFQLLEIIPTYNKTKMRLERQIHKEILILGYEFKVTNGVKTEWFFVPIEKEQEFAKQGLSQFQCCKGRTIYKA